jgi:hypothetical protein
MSDALGIIAGNGDFPLILVQAARRQGVKHIVAAAFEGETNPDLARFVDAMDWVVIGQLDKLIKVFTSRGITRAVLAGGITPGNLFKNLRLDFRVLAVAARLRERNAETIFGAVVEELGKDGVEVLDPRPFLGDNVPQAGHLTRAKPDREQREDIAFGFRIAKEVSRLDIGQTVVVKRGTVLAVEGFEGSDACIRRGGDLAGDSGGAVVVKVSKPNHDFRFDIPCVGLRTIESCAAGRIAVLAVEAGRTLLLDRPSVQAAADAHRLCIEAINI